MNFTGRVATLFAAMIAVALLTAPAYAVGKDGVVTITLNPTVSKDSKTVDVWLPYPLSNEAQDISNVSVTGNFANSAVYRDSDSGAVFLHATWPSVQEEPELKFRFHVDMESRKVGQIKESAMPIPAPIREKYLESTLQVPAEMFKEKAAEIVAGKTTILEKARAIYDWTVDNTVRDPNVKGCGLANPGRTLYECNGGGKCADISAVFVTFARAAGVPARDVYGLRLGTPKNGDITSGFHCWAEFYLPGTGWVPVDPADVRKMMLVHDLKLGDKAAKEWREFFWGGDDLFRITLNKDSRGVKLGSGERSGTVNYFMYPFAQVDGRALNYFDPKTFKYSVSYNAD